MEEIIKEAFSQGWNASHECATDFDYEYALRNCLSELDGKIKKLNIPAVKKSVCDDCTAYPFYERGKTPICKTCKDNHSQTVL